MRIYVGMQDDSYFNAVALLLISVSFFSTMYAVGYSRGGLDEAVGCVIEEALRIARQRAR
jgi:hypothetical protein